MDINLLKETSQQQWPEILIGCDETTLVLGIKIEKIGPYEESEAYKEVKALEEAYNKIPSSDAEYKEIKNFIMSCKNADKKDVFYSLDLELLKSWKKYH